MAAGLREADLGFPQDGLHRHHDRQAGSGKSGQGASARWALDAVQKPLQRHRQLQLGSLLGFAQGGLVMGRGTGTSDSNLVAVSAGEFITNAAATKKYRPLLEVINAGK